MRKRWFELSLAGMVLLAASLISCTGRRSDPGDQALAPGKEKVIEALTLFVESVQGDRFDKALSYLTLIEKRKMTEGTGMVPPLVQRQLKALRLSTLANKPGVRLAGGKLEGIHDNLPALNATPSKRTANTDAPLIP